MGARQHLHQGWKRTSASRSRADRRAADAAAGGGRTAQSWPRAPTRGGATLGVGHRDAACQGTVTRGGSSGRGPRSRRTRIVASARCGANIAAACPSWVRRRVAAPMAGTAKRATALLRCATRARARARPASACSEASRLAARPSRPCAALGDVVGRIDGVCRPVHETSAGATIANAARQVDQESGRTLLSLGGPSSGRDHRETRLAWSERPAVCWRRRRVAQGACRFVAAHRAAYSSTRMQSLPPC